MNRQDLRYDNYRPNDWRFPRQSGIKPHEMRGYREPIAWARCAGIAVGLFLMMTLLYFSWQVTR